MCGLSKTALPITFLIAVFLSFNKKRQYILKTALPITFLIAEKL